VVFQSAIVAGLLFQRRRRRQAENSLRDSEDRMSFAAVSASIGLWQFDRATEELWAAEPCREILGFAKNTPVTLDTFLAAAHPDDRHILLDTLRKSKGERSAGTDIRIVQPNGELRWVRIRARAYIDGQEAPNQLSGMFVDVTEQKTAESEAELQRQEVAHLTRVTVLGELSGAIAHEVNQPLSGIITNASTCLRMLAADPPDIDGARVTAKRTIRDGNRASDVIARLRELFIKKEFTLEPLDLNEAARDVIALSSNDLQRNRVILQSELADGLPFVTGDRIQLQQVILNLLRNASDAMVDVHDRPRQLLIKTEREDGQRVRLAVRDAGVGLPPRSVDSLFDAFYTTKSGGMGIGLFVSRSIVEKHQGRLWAQPNDGPGATFFLSIPCASEIVAAAAPAVRHS